MSRYDGADCYVYPGTEVLRNKADIRDQAALDAFEADVTALRMLELAESPVAVNAELVSSLLTKLEAPCRALMVSHWLVPADRALPYTV